MSMADRDGFIWYDGRLVPWRDATTHVLTHSLHYGLAVFEGVRAYKTEARPGDLPLKEHTERLFNSAKIFMMEIPSSREQLFEAQREWSAPTSSNRAICARSRSTARKKWA
jgi:branched-chain amino acid aminotransferase